MSCICPETGEKPRRLIRDLVLIEERGCVEIGEDLEAAGSDAAPEVLHIRQVPMRIHHGLVANPVVKAKSRFDDLLGETCDVTRLQDENHVAEEARRQIRRLFDDAFLL